MKNLLRCLVLALVLVPTLAIKAQPSSSSLESACPNGGRCKISGADCVVNQDCGSTGGICVCF